MKMRILHSTFGLMMLAGLVLGGLAAFRSHPPAVSELDKATRLKVVSFNVQFLPVSWINKRPDASYRAQMTARRLASNDIVGLNEMFDKRPRQQMLDVLRTTWGEDFHLVEPPPQERSVFGLDSGLVLASRLPIVSSHSLKYGNDSSPLTHGLRADGFAAKGALHARVLRGRDGRPDDYLDVFVTHIESEDARIREAQYPLFADFVRKYSDPGQPVLILGDFNTDGRPPFQRDPKAQYPRLLEVLRGSRPGANLVDLWPAFSAEPGGTNDPDTVAGGERIDYIFVSNPAAGPALKPLAMRVNRMLDGRVVSLSDHSAVEAELVWHRSR